MIANKIEKTNQNTKSKILEYCKNHKKLIITESIGLIFCLAMSFIFHYAYDWFGRPSAIAFLFATNESVWEHSKIIFYPYLIFSIIEYFVLKIDLKVFISAKSIPLVFCIPTMTTIFYTYSGIIGKNFLAIDIIMTISIITAMFVFNYKMMEKKFVVKHYILLSIIVGLILILLIVFTYLPPHIGLFFDESKGIYGLQKP